MKIKDVFISPQERRLRAGWRLLVQLILFVLVSLVIAIPVVIVTLLEPGSEMVLLLLASDIPMVASVLAARAWIDRRSIASLGLRLNRQALNDVLVGVGISVLQVGTLFGLLWAFGWLHLDGGAWEQQSLGVVAGNLVLWFGLFILVGFAEELFSRGYQLQNLEEGLNTFWAVVISSSVFGALHLSNPNAALGSVIGVTLAGFFLAYPYLRTRQLWLSIGLHLGWNYFLGPVFGFSVSGIGTSHLLQISVDGPAWFTGGAFGPEAGVVLLPALGVGALFVWLYTRGRLSAAGDREIVK